MESNAVKYLKAKGRYTGCLTASLNISTADSWFGPRRRSFFGLPHPPSGPPAAPPPTGGTAEHNIFLAYENLHPPGHPLTATLLSDTKKEKHCLPDWQATCLYWATQNNRPAVSTVQRTHQSRHELNKTKCVVKHKLAVCLWQLRAPITFSYRFVAHRLRHLRKATNGN